MLFRLGSVGQEVKRIQSRLKDLGLYTGPVDGIFGGATESAVKRFQRQKGIKVDGIVGPETLDLLFAEETAHHFETFLSYPLDYRCLILTGTFETGLFPPECFSALTGNFDGQGISFGALQWNFGQGSLQPLLKDMFRNYREVIESIFGEYSKVLEEVLDNKEEAIEFALSIQHPVKHIIYEPWKGLLRELGRTKEFQNIQLKYADNIYTRAIELCHELGLRTERGVALMFDIIVQCGSLKRITKERLAAELPKIEEEEKKLEVIAKTVSQQVNPRWQADVFSRKLCIARGKGIVHGVWYDLEEQFGITLKEI